MTWSPKLPKEAWKQARDLDDGPAGTKDTKQTVELQWNSRVTLVPALACFQSTGSECGSEDGKPGPVERERLARKPGCSFLVQIGFEDLEKQ